MVRDFQARADQENAKRRKAMPLFADVVEQTTAHEQYWRWRRNVAKAAEHMGLAISSAAAGLRWIKVQQYRRLARQHLSAEQYAQTEQRIEATFKDRDPSYHLDVWFQELAKAIPGLREAAIRGVQFPEQPEQVDDGGVYERLQAVFARVEKVSK